MGCLGAGVWRLGLICVGYHNSLNANWLFGPVEIDDVFVRRIALVQPVSSCSWYRFSTKFLRHTAEVFSFTLSPFFLGVGIHLHLWGSRRGIEIVMCLCWFRSSSICMRPVFRLCFTLLFFCSQANTLRPYLTCIRNTLTAAMCLQVYLRPFSHAQICEYSIAIAAHKFSWRMMVHTSCFGLRITQLCQIHW